MHEVLGNSAPQCEPWPGNLAGLGQCDVPLWRAADSLNAVHAGLGQWDQQMPDRTSDVGYQILVVLMQHFGAGTVAVGQMGFECRWRYELAVKIIRSENHLTR